MAKSKKRKINHKNTFSENTKKSKGFFVKLMCIILAALMALSIATTMIVFLIDEIRTRRAAKQNANPAYTYPVELYDTESPTSDDIIIDDPIEVTITSAPDSVPDDITSEVESATQPDTGSVESIPVTEAESSESSPADSVDDSSSMSN
ncbi:MAG: hypothetical protein II399_09525 [Lachnospiraceae bacterium]|nr:hypothetical protein [Lachnospiraceae bacterium]